MDEQKERGKQERILIISRRLLIFVALSLAATAISCGVTFFFAKRFMVSWFSFECGVIGGFVSIQQRLKTIDGEELAFLSGSWVAVLVIPIFGGVFALILYLLFLSGILEGHLFPEFALSKFSDCPTTEEIKSFLAQTYPKTPQDFALFAFWSFAAGFSERLVPQIIEKVTSDNEGGT